MAKIWSEGFDIKISLAYVVNCIELALKNFNLSTEFFEAAQNITEIIFGMTRDVLFEGRDDIKTEVGSPT